MIKKLIRKLVGWAHTETLVAEASPYMSQTKGSPISSNNTISDRNPGLNFTVYGASGGKVIQVHSYDTRTDRVISNLHIVTDNENLGEELALIITRESISR